MIKAYIVECDECLKVVFFVEADWDNFLGLILLVDLYHALEHDARHSLKGLGQRSFVEVKFMVQLYQGILVGSMPTSVPNSSGL